MATIHRKNDFAKVSKNLARYTDLKIIFMIVMIMLRLEKSVLKSNPLLLLVIC